MEKDLICIVCPNGCRLHAETSENGEITVSGNTCPKGAGFARAELTHPMRSLTTTVKTVFPNMPFIPARTKGEIPKEMVFPLMKELSRYTLHDKVSCGDVILHNVLDTGCDIIATSDLY